MLHTIIFIVISMIISVVPFLVNRDIKINLIYAFAIFLFIYFFYIIIGYAYILTKYIIARKEQGSLISQFRHDNIFRVTIFNALSAFYAFLYALFSHLMMYFLDSYFYLIIAEIYIAIALIKIYLILHTTNFEVKKPKIDVCIIIFLFAMTILIFACAILIYTDKGTFNKYSFLVYVYAFYAFYALISAIVSFIKARLVNNQIRQRYFLVKFACASFSMYTLMVSLLNQFSKEETLKYHLIGGIVFGIIILTEALVLLIIKIRNRHLILDK